MRKILVVEDNAVNRKILLRILKDEYEVLEAANGVDALKVLNDAYDVISAVVLDIYMPQMDGYEVLSIMRADAKLKRIPVIVATGSTEEGSEVRALSLGANDYIVKPYKAEVIRHRLWNTINLRETAAIVNMATKDELTGLYNREAFFQKAAELIAERESGHYVLCCMDIDNFKLINDQFGSDKGDEVLRCVAEAYQRVLSPIEGICCRIMADNFAALYPGCRIRPEQLERARLEAEELGGGAQPITISTGLYIVTDKSLSVSAMYDRAVIAKTSVKGRFDVHHAVFADNMRDTLLREQEIISEMNSALASGQFEVWLQPQYNHSTGALIGAEALVRWRHPARGLVSPGLFIPVFERNGFIYELDKYVWEQVCALLRRWLDEGREVLPISVNVSRYDVLRGDLTHVIVGLMQKYDIPASLLRLEITESAFATSTVQMIAVVKQLIDFGFTMEIDDFGSGYSSLNTLKDVPAQVLKLDMRFLENTENSLRGGNILESIVRMTKWLGMTVIAEGVETVAQANFLKSVGCSYVQGYLYARPMPISEYELVLRDAKKEARLSRMETADNLDNNAFWDPSSMDTLIFNSYVGAACIIEYHRGKIELLRVNDKFARVLGCGFMTTDDALKLKFDDHMDDSGREIIREAIEESVITGDEATRELLLSDLPGCPQKTYLRASLRVIASAGERHLVYLTNENLTAQREAEEKQRLAEKKRLEAAEQMRAIMDNVRGGVTALHIVGERAEFAFSNDEYYAMQGYTREQFESEVDKPFSLVHPDDRALVRESIETILKGRDGCVFEYRTMKRDGEYIYVRSNSSITSIEGIGENVLLSVMTDITELVHAEKLVRETTEQLKAILANIDGGVTAVTLEGDSVNMLFANPNYYSMLGYTKEQFEAEVTRIYDLIYPEDREYVIGETRRASEYREPVSLTFRAIRRDGVVRWHQSNIAIVSLPGVDEPVQLTVATDVTERRAAERSERMANARVQVIMDNAPGGVVASVPRGDDFEFILANECYYDTLGYTREQYSAEVKSIYDLIHEEDRARVAQVTERAYTSGQNERLEYRVICRDGRLKWMSTSITTAYLEDWGERALIVVITDVTREKETLAELREADLQLRFLNSAAHELLSHADADEGVKRVLSMLVDHFGGRRAQIYEREPGTNAFTQTYEACAEGVESLLKHKDLVLVENPLMQSEFERGEIVYLDLHTAPEAFKESIMKVRKTSGQVAAPILRNGELIGLLGIDDPEKRRAQAPGLSAISDYLAAILTHRDMDQKIKRDNQALESIMNDTPGGFARLRLRPNIDSEAVYVNASLAAILGSTSIAVIESMRGDVFKIVHPDDKAPIVAHINAAITGNKRIHARLRLRHVSGGYVPVLAFGNLLPGKAGDYYLNIHYIDLSESEHSRLTAQETMPLVMQAIMGNSDDISFVKDRDLKYICASPEFVKLMGASGESELLGKTDYELFARDIADKYREADLRLIETGESLLNIIDRLPSRDNEPHYSSTSKYLLRDENGRVMGIYGVGRDVTRERDAFEQLKLLTDHFPGGLAKVELTREGVNILYMSEGMRELLGYAAEECATIARERRLGELVLENAHIAHEQALNMLVDGSPVDCACMIRRKDGGSVWVNLRAAMSERRGESVIANAVLYDITQSKRAEENMRQVIELIDNSSSAVYVCDAKNYDMLYANKRTAAMCQKTVAEAYGQKCYQYLKNMDKPCEECFICSSNAHEYTERVYTSPITGRHYMSRGKLMMWHEREAMVEYMIDETERINAQKGLNELVEGIPGGIGIYHYYNDGRLEVVYLNNGYYNTLRTTRERRARFDSFSVINAIHPDDLPAIKAALNRLAVNGDMLNCDYRVLLDNGQYKWLNVRASVAGRSDDKCVLFASYTDVDDDKKTRLQLEASRRVLALANEENDTTLWLYDMENRTLLNELQKDAWSLDTHTIENVPECILESGAIHEADKVELKAMYDRLHEGCERSECVARVINNKTRAMEWRHIVYTRLYDPYYKGKLAVGMSTNVDEQQKTLIRYERERGLKHELVKDSLIFYEINLATGVIEEYKDNMTGDVITRTNIVIDATVERDIIKYVDLEYREAVYNTLSLKALREANARGETSAELVYRREYPDGSRRWVRTIASIIKRSGSGDAVAFVYARDITDEQNARLALDSILADDMESVCLINVKTGMARYINTRGEQADELLFYYNSRVLEKVGEFVSADDRAVCLSFYPLDSLKRALAREQGPTITFQIRRTDGIIRWKCAKAAYLDDTREHIVLTRRDVTSLYEEEEHKKRALEAAVHEANEANNAKSEFLSRMSHDMRTPLNAVIGMVNLAKELPNPTQTNEYLENIDISSHFLLGLINDILDLSKIESGNFELNNSMFTLDEFERSINTVIKPLMDAKDIDFAMHLAGGPDGIYVDKLRFTQIFFNLLTNAAKYTPPGGRVEFTAEHMGDDELGRRGMRFIVRDSGTGMSEEFQKVAFEPFTQEHPPEHAREQSSGLGLAIVKRLVRSMGGEITLASSPGKGTTIYVEIYAYVRMAGVDAQPDKHIPDDLLNGTRVLLVEDNVMNTIVAKRLLENKGCYVETAANGLAGLNMFINSAPGAYHLVIMDIRMPVMDGVEAARRMRESGHKDAARIPIIALTADAMRQEQERTRAAGMNAYISKPIEPVNLIQTVYEHSRKMRDNV